MMYNEFTERTGFYPDANLYRAIEEAYYDFNGDKNEFCKAYQANKDGLAEHIARAACQRAQDETKKAENKLWEVRDDLRAAERKIKRLEATLEREQEWTPWTDKDSISDHFYVSGKAAAYNSFENDKEAKGWIASEFGFAESKIEILHTIDMLNAIWRRKEYERFCNMCYLLGVSKQALSIRMMRLGLLGEEHLQHPNEILDVYMEEDENE